MSDAEKSVPEEQALGRVPVGAERIDSEFVIARINAGSVESAWVNLDGKQLAAIVFPAAVTNTQFKFKGRDQSTEDGEFITEVLTPTTDIVCPVVVSKRVPLPLSVFCTVSSIKLVGTAQEAEARDIKLIVRPLS